MRRFRQPIDIEASRKACSDGKRRLSTRGPSSARLQASPRACRAILTPRASRRAWRSRAAAICPARRPLEPGFFATSLPRRGPLASSGRHGDRTSAVRRDKRTRQEARRKGAWRIRNEARARSRRPWPAPSRGGLRLRPSCHAGECTCFRRLARRRNHETGVIPSSGLLAVAVARAPSSWFPAPCGVAEVTQRLLDKPGTIPGAIGVGASGREYDSPRAGKTDAKVPNLEQPRSRRPWRSDRQPILSG